MVNTVYIDGAEKVMGRLASLVAKMALEGKKVIVLNCDKIVITGDRNAVIQEFAADRRDIRGRHKGPIWPKRPDTIFRKCAKRMLPFNKERGDKALKRIEAYIGMPKEYASHPLLELKQAERHITNRYIYLGYLSEKIGSTRWKQ